MRTKISGSITCGILLALSGGCMDAYSYLFRGHVFANAQTGNILLFGVNLANGDIPGALNYLWPVLAFTAGIILSDIINGRKSIPGVRLRQFSVLVEAVILAVTAFIPTTMDPLANSLISFGCGIQLESFREIRGSSIATTMCIGNLRSGTYNLDKYISTRERPYLSKALLYYGIIVSFVIGAIIESKVIKLCGIYAILLSTVLLIICALLMFREPEAADAFE